MLRFRRLRTGDGWTLLEIEPQTGRMHQIRLQASLRGWPVRGDQLYGSSLPFGPAVGAAARARHRPACAQPDVFAPDPLRTHYRDSPATAGLAGVARPRRRLRPLNHTRPKEDERHSRAEMAARAEAASASGSTQIRPGPYAAAVQVSRTSAAMPATDSSTPVRLKQRSVSWGVTSPAGSPKRQRR